MKKTFIPLLMFLLLITISGCNESGNNNGNIDDDKLSINDYFSEKGDCTYVFQGEGNEYASYTITIDYTADNKIQRRINNGGTEMVQVIEISDGKLIKAFQKGEIYYRENFLNTEQTGGKEILLMEPIEEGTTWTLEDNSKCIITDISAQVETPSGEYDTIEVVTEGENGKMIDYYAKGIGLVKEVFKYEETEISSTLSRIEEDTPLTQEIRFYYPNIEDRKYYYTDRLISFYTNDITEEILAEAYRELPNNSIGKVFSENTKINSIHLDESSMLSIDLNDSFMKEMNAGALYEGMILQSIANTFGEYYNAEKLILTIDNQLYESGHIAFKEGESLTVDYTDIEEIK